MKKSGNPGGHLINLGSLLGVIFWFVITAGLVTAAPKESQIHQGMVDLTCWDFQTKGIFTLAGEWEFYWQRLLTPQELARGAWRRERNYFPVTQLWKNYYFQGKRLSHRGYATYRLQFKINSQVKMMGLILPEIYSAARVWVNGKLLVNNGQVGQSLKTSLPGNRESYDFFEVVRGVNEIVIQVANFHYKDGGMEVAPKIGLMKQIVLARERNRAFNFFNLGCLSLIGCLYLVLYLTRRQEKEFLSLTLICLVIGSRMLATGDRYFYEIFPSCSWEIVMKIQYISASIIGYLLLQFLSAFLSKEISKIIANYLVLIPVVFIMIVAIFPARIYTELLGILNILVFLGVIGVVFSGFIDLIKDKKWLKLIIVVFLLFGLSGANGLMQLIGVVNFGILFPLGILFYIVLQSFILGKKYTNAFAENEALSQKLLKLDRMKDEFMINTSDELRMPLNGIIGISESLLEGVAGRLPPKVVSNLEMLNNSAKRLANLINDLLDFVKLKNHQLALKNNKIALYQLTEMVLAISQSLVGTKQLKLVNQVPLELPLIEADEDRLQQIMCNLISNAIKYTEDGTITISASLVNQEIRVMVSDTGIGIANEQLERIFRLFEEIDDFGFQSEHHPGLGLNITKYLVELHGGKIWVESKVSEGSNFTFTLPRRQSNLENLAVHTEALVKVESTKTVQAQLLEVVEIEAKFEPRIETKIEQKSSENAKLILVDDEKLNLLVLENVLSLEKYQVKTFTNGYDALQEIETGGSYDLVILDAMMPKISGYELCRQIRDKFSLFELPIIILTMKGQGNILEGFKCGANDYLMKPFEKKELLVRVRTLLILKKAVRDALNYYEEVQEGYLGTVFALANSIEAKDIYTRGHCQRVMEYAVKIASELQLSQEEIIQLKYAALLHDIGKIGIDSSILNKPSRLTDEEYAEIKKHPQIAYNILAPVKFLENSLDGVMQHHEWYNGRGYPHNLAGEEISLFGRILGVVDAFDAMTSDRSYRKGMQFEMAIVELTKNKGIQFDPLLTEIFIEIIKTEGVYLGAVAQ